MRPLPILWAATALCFRFVRPCACGAPAPVFSEGGGAENAGPENAGPENEGPNVMTCSAGPRDATRHDFRAIFIPETIMRLAHSPVT